MSIACTEHEYKCPSGGCLSTQEFCDGWSQCEDGADENNCSKHGKLLHDKVLIISK